MQWACRCYERLSTLSRWCCNEIISELIYELTGHERSRQAVAAHFQVLTRAVQRRGIVNTQCSDTKKITKVVKPRPAVSIEKSPVTEDSGIFCHLSTIASNPNGLSVHCNTSFAHDFLPLSSENHFYRNECFHYLTSTACSDFDHDGHALHRFCSTAPAEALAAIHHLGTCHSSRRLFA